MYTYMDVQVYMYTILFSENLGANIDMIPFIYFTTYLPKSRTFCYITKSMTVTDKTLGMSTDLILLPNLQIFIYILPVVSFLGQDHI